MSSQYAIYPAHVQSIHYLSCPCPASTPWYLAFSCENSTFRASISIAHIQSVPKCYRPCHHYYPSLVSTPYLLPISSQYTISPVHVQLMHPLSYPCPVRVSPLLYPLPVGIRLSCPCQVRIQPAFAAHIPGIISSQYIISPAIIISQYHLSWPNPWPGDTPSLLSDGQSEYHLYYPHNPRSCIINSVVSMNRIPSSSMGEIMTSQSIW